MTIKQVLAAVACAAILAPAMSHEGHPHTKPPHKTKPQPAPTEQRGGGGDAVGLLVGLGLAATLGYVVYAHKREQDEKRVEIKPTQDAKGAALTYTWRY